MITRLRRFAAPVALTAATIFGVSVVDASVAGAASTSVAARSYVTPGAFCAKSEVGRIDYSKNNVKMQCSYAQGDNRARWREVTK